MVGLDKDNRKGHWFFAGKNKIQEFL